MNHDIDNPRTTNTHANLGVGIGLRAAHYLEFRAANGPMAGIDWLEVHTENVWHVGGHERQMVEHVRRDYPLSLHGVGLGLGSASGLNAAHLAQLAQVVRELSPALVSEHLCWNASGAHVLNDLLPLPYTEASLQLVCERVDRVQNTLQRQILIENLSSYVRFAAHDYDEIAFLNALSTRTGCGLLLDLNNLYVNQCNHGDDAAQAIAQVHAHAVGELHLAGHSSSETLVIDDHSAPVCAAVWNLYRLAVARMPHVATLVEWDTNVPPLPVLCAQVDAARAIRERL